MDNLDGGGLDDSLADGDFAPICHPENEIMAPGTGEPDGSVMVPKMRIMVTPDWFETCRHARQ